MDTATKSGVWVIATAGDNCIAIFGAAAYSHLLRWPCSCSSWMEGFARAIDNSSVALKRGPSRVIAILTVLAGFIGFIALMARGIGQFGRDAGEYERQINSLIADGYGLFQLGDAPTLSSLLFNETGANFLRTVASEMGDLSGNVIIILIYVAFLFTAQSSWTHKLDNIFPQFDQRSQVRQIGDDARRGIETYLWTQTVISALITALTYASLLALGVDNALFLAALIFVLNYIPTVGSIVAAMVPPLFALVQPEANMPGWIPGSAPQDTYIYAGIVLGVVSFWQFRSAISFSRA